LVERLGISILDLLPQATDLANFVPDEAVEQLGVLTVLISSRARFPDHVNTLFSPEDDRDQLCRLVSIVVRR
jgi:hypothetical protein